MGRALVSRRGGLSTVRFSIACGRALFLGYRYREAQKFARILRAHGLSASVRAEV